MTETPFEIELHLERRYMILRASGFWTPAIADQYEKAMEDAYRKLKPGGSWRILSDRRKSSPQTPEVQETMARVMRRATECGLTHTAFVVSSFLTEHQLQRIGKPGLLIVEFFREEKDALDWLLSAP